MGTVGWAILEARLGQLSLEVSDYYYAAESADDFHYRKGYLDGHNRTLNYIAVLIAASEGTEEEALQGELEKMLDPFRQMTLPKEQNEAQERISRVLERATRMTFD